MIEISKGILLIAEPFMKDKNFQRSVVLICEHQEEGAFGMVINKKRRETVGDYVADLENCPLPLYDGGPVKNDHIHFLHNRPDIIPGGAKITNEIFWGGDFSIVSELSKKGLLKDSEIRFYLGYSGWDAEQLDDEMKEKSWLTTKATPQLVFEKNISIVWKNSVKELGDEFYPMINYPTDPQLN